MNRYVDQTEFNISKHSLREMRIVADTAGWFSLSNQLWPCLHLLEEPEKPKTYHRGGLAAWLDV